MPELPEVETVRQVLRRKIINKTITHVDILYDKIIKTEVEAFSKILLGKTIHEVDRIGKYLLIRLGDYTLISHLRMEGKYFLKETIEENTKHDHIIFNFSDQTKLVYNDVRKFGTMHLKLTEEVYDGEPLDKLGLEPFDENFTASFLLDRFKSKRSIKTTLLDQTIVVGLGNIYVDEVLYLSRIHPETPSHVLSLEDCQKIKEASIDVLNQAIVLGGSTIRSYYSDHEITGRFQNKLRVHLRKDEACFECQTPIIKIKVGGRGTYLCPKCQSND